MFTLDFKAIGTGWFIDILDVPNLQKDKISSEIKEITSDFENLYSRFKDNSLVGQLNTVGVLENPPEELLEMINVGEGLKKITQGSFDLMVGKRLSDLGYDKNLSFKEVDFSKSNVDSHLSSNSIEFSKSKVKISSGSILDLGGIGKGFLIDKVSRFLKDENYFDFTVNAGGDIYCSGSSLKNFYLENPFDNTQAIGEIELKEGSVACSSSSKRNWKGSTKQLHHLVNMKSGMPVDEIAAVFTYGKTATNTDLGSTAIFVSDNSLWSKIAEYLKIEFLVVFANGNYFQTSDYPGRMYK